MGEYAPARIPVIEIVELSKYYGEARAVGPLSFTIEKGEIVGLLGLNGAGKTTTLRMLASDLLPTSGRMVVDGVDLAAEPGLVRARIGYLPDRPPLYGEMTVREFLEFAARLRDVAASDVPARVSEVLGLTSLVERADDRIDTLSHGFKQRVGIAQAIVHKPSLLLLDEPISGLDPVQIVEMRELIRSLRGVQTIVISSHILSEISETCDRLLVLRDGSLVAQGSESELREHMVTHDLAVVVRLAADETEAELVELVRGLDGVTRVARGAADEPGADAVKLAVSATADVRAEVCRALCAKGYAVVGLERGARELESVFLELAGRGKREREEAAS